jgi:hypothetical protein
VYYQVGVLPVHLKSSVFVCFWTAVACLLCVITTSGEPPVHPEAVDYDTYKETLSYQYHTHFTFPLKDGALISRIVVVEQKLHKHSLAIFDENGYILAHAVPNLCLCLSVDTPGNITLYSGAGLHASFGVTESDDLGFSFLRMVEPNIARSRCNSIKLQELTSSRFTTPLLKTELFTITQDERAGICRKIYSSDESRVLCSVRVTTKVGGFGLYKLDNKDNSEVSFLEFVKNPKEAGELVGKRVEITRENNASSIGDEINDLCSGINAKEASTREASERLWRRFKKKDCVILKQEQKIRIENLLGQLIEKDRNSESTLEQLGEILKVQRIDTESTNIDNTSKQDPYDLGWRSLVFYGPTLFKAIQDKLYESYSSRTLDTKSRMKALNLLCKLGWLPDRNAIMGKAYVESGREIGDNSCKDFVRDINQIEWQLIIDP